MEAEMACIVGSVAGISAAVILMMCLMVDIRDALRRIAAALETRKGE